MDSKIGKKLSHIMDHYDEVTTRDDYSGRSMYGNTTFALVAESKEFVLEILLDDFDKGYIERDDYVQMTRAVLDARVDQMGLDKVIY